MLSPWFTRLRPAHTPRSKRSNRRLSRRPLLEDLESRQLMTSFSVTNTNDAGTGSLRQAIVSSDAVMGPNSINFNIPGNGVQTINVLSPLPTITQQVTVNGTSQPGYAGSPVIVLDGTNAGSSAVGLTLHASNSTVKGLVIDGFAVAGILIDGASADTITNDYLGVTAAGNGAKANFSGIVISGGAKGNFVTGDVISGNRDFGVELSGTGTTGNVVASDYIGTDTAGLHALPNLAGVGIIGGASGNTIGGTTFNSRDVISGNTASGVDLTDIGTTGNVVEGDYIGTDAAGAGPWATAPGRCSF